MSTSFIEYRGHGFWSWDGYLEHALALLAQSIGNSPEEDWLVSLGDRRREQSSGGFRGSINPRFDELVTNDERQKRVVSLLDGILVRPGLTCEAPNTAKFLHALM